MALREMKLVSGGSGLAIGLAWAQRHGARGESAQAGMPLAGPAVVLSALLGDDQQQRVAYRQQAPRAVDLSACFTDLELRQDAD